MIEKKLQKYIIPNILAMLGMSCYILADTFFISASAGTNGITALNLTLPIYGLIFAIGSMIGIGSSIRYSLSKTTGDKGAEGYFSNAILWDIIIGLIFTGLGIFCPELVLRVMGADTTILAIGTSYIRIALCFSPFFMLNYTFTSFVRNDGAPKIAMAATLLSSLFNIVFDYILMFPCKMGMTGAALATAVSPILSICICMIHYLSKNNTVKFMLIRPSVKKLFAACNLGIAAFVGEIASGITTMVFNFILLDLSGNTAVAAYGVIANMALVGTAIFNGISQGLQPLASEAHGQGDTETEHRILKRSILIAIVLAVAVVAVIFIFAEQFVGIFNSEHSVEMADLAVIGIRVYFVGFLIASLNIVRAGFFSAIDHGKESSVIAVSRGIVSIVVFAFLLSRLFGIMGVWLAFPAAELFTLFISIGFKSNEK